MRSQLTTASRLVLMVVLLCAAAIALSAPVKVAASNPSAQANPSLSQDTGQTTQSTGKGGGVELGQIYIWFLGVVGISALFSIVRGGVLYMFSGTNPSRVSEAKKWIWNALFGLLIAAGSYILLNTINPDLVEHNFDLGKIISDKMISGSSGSSGK